MPALRVDEFVNVIVRADPPCGAKKIIRIGPALFEENGAIFDGPAKNNKEGQQCPQNETQAFCNGTVGNEFLHAC